MKRLRRIRKDGVPAYSFVKEVAEAYQTTRREFIHPRYNCFKTGSDPTKHKSWVHFEKAAKLINELNMAPKDFMELQFLRCTRTSFPRPNNLYSRRAKNLAQRQNLSDREIALIDINERWLNTYVQTHGIEAGKIVLWPAIKFSEWFRAYHCNEPVPKVIAKAAKDQLRSDELVDELISRNYDVNYLLNRINKALED